MEIMRVWRLIIGMGGGEIEIERVIAGMELGG